MVDAAKEQHYTLQLQLALTAGHWESATPAKTPKGISLSWSELFRKLRKHSRRTDVTEAASQTQFLSLLLHAKRVTLDGTDEEACGTPFHLANECILPEERREEAQKAFQTLKELDSSDQTVLLTLAYYAYALEQPRESLSYLSNIASPELFQPLYGKSAEVVSEKANSSANEIVGAMSAPVLVEEGRMWRLMEAIRSSCLEGMSHEKISPKSPLVALSSYDRGVRLLASNAIARSAPTRSGKANFESFTKYRELWRWTERLLWRDIILSAKHRSTESTLQSLRIYASHSTHWPPSFRASRRSIICSIHLRALIALAACPQSTVFTSKVTWMNESRSVIHECRAILSASTKFPSAGGRNVQVEEFVDLCVGVWEAGGCVSDQSSWVLDILWWATRLTFNSPRILRHMTRLLHVSGDDDLAKRTLKLYVQIVSKARETANGDKDRPSIAEPVSLDSDEKWVETLVHGARMLCRIPGGVTEAREAAALVEQARQRVGGLGEEYEAKVDLADGMCKSVLAMREHEPSSRVKLLSQSLELILRAISKYPTASAHYHAGLAFSRPTPERNLERAVAHCRHAIEADSKEVRYWHLLSLLETKLGEWKKAQGVLDAANDIAESLELKEQNDDSVTTRDYANANGNGSRNGVSTPGRSSPNANERTVQNRSSDDDALQESLLSPIVDELPPAATLLQPIPDHPPPTEREQFEMALQLRMTQLALTELVDDQESVENCWLLLFEWYAQRKDLHSSGLYKPSMESTRFSSDFEMIGHRDSFEGNLIDTPQTGPTTSVAGTDTTRASLEAPTVTSHPRMTLEVTSEIPELILPDSPSRSFRDKVMQRTEGTRRYRSRSVSPERDRDKSTGKRVQKMLKEQVHKQSARINTISKKIGHGVARGGGSILQRASSAPDFHAVLTRTGPYQASSIHSRKRVISWGSRSQRGDLDRGALSPSPPPPPSLPPLQNYDPVKDVRSKRERRMLSDLWVMSAASFRRVGKIDQAAAAIREAELLDEENEAVWVQLGLYFAAMGEENKAIESFHKALFIAPDDASAMIHLSHIYLTSQSSLLRSSSYGAVDLATGMLETLTRGAGWDIPEAWYLLAKAYGMQGRKSHERVCLTYALGLAEVQGIRDIGVAIGWCL